MRFDAPQTMTFNPDVQTEAIHLARASVHQASVSIFFRSPDYLLTCTTSAQ
jgi:hypothetical protein